MTPVWCVTLVGLNVFWILGEFTLIGMGIHSLHNWKVELDTSEHYDSTYISYMLLYLMCLIIAVCLLATIFEAVATYLMYEGARTAKGRLLKICIVITTIITVISISGAIMFHQFCGYFAFGGSVDYQPFILTFWCCKIVYSVVQVVIVVAHLRRKPMYVNGGFQSPTNNNSIVLK